MSRPAVVFGGPSPEHDVSVLTGLRAARTLAQAGHDPLALYWGKTGGWYSVDPLLEAGDFAEGPPRRAQELTLALGPDGGFLARKRRLDVSVAVNCTHGGPGEDGTLQAAFDLAGIRATGPGVAGASLGMDKYAFGGAVAAAGLRTLPRALLTPGGDLPALDFPPPYIVKPRFGGSSIGIETVESLDDAAAYVRSSPHTREGAVVEPFLAEARDVNVAIRTYPALELSAIERPLRHDDAAAILDYRQKYLRSEGLEGAPRELPARLPPQIEAEVRASASRVAAVASVRSVARLDFLLHGEDVYVNEINTIPGSLASYLWVEPPVPFERLLLDMIEEAERSPARQFTTAGSDGSVLRAAGSIASKLA